MKFYIFQDNSDTVFISEVCLGDFYLHTFRIDTTKFSGFAIEAESVLDGMAQYNSNNIDHLISCEDPISLYSTEIIAQYLGNIYANIVGIEKIMHFIYGRTCLDLIKVSIDNLIQKIVEDDARKNI